MDEKLNRVPVNLLYLSQKEYFISCAVLGAAIGLGYVIGRERQRRWVDKHLISLKKTN